MDANIFEEDLRVLTHLRGYPEDLRHYSNLIKQAHPRGTSALRMVLSRPSASASLIAAIAQRISEGTDIVSAIEAAELFAVPPRQFLEEVASRPDFPAPLFAAEHRRIWRRADVEAYRARG
jgi:predicted HTH domain antitoxin